MSRRLILAAVLLTLVPWALLAAPALTLGTATIPTDYTGTVRLTVTGVADASMTLTLYSDANGDGLVTAGQDVPVYLDRIPDNAARWSTEMASDLSATPGTVVVDLRWFTPVHYPHTAGNYIWTATDSGGTDSKTFQVTRTATTLVLTGEVQDYTAGTPVPGALVVVSPLGQQEGDGPSCIADAAGNYTLYLPAAWDGTCLYRLILPSYPGSTAILVNQTSLSLDGQPLGAAYSDLPAGTWSIAGKVTYSSGPLSGSGIPGVVVQAQRQGGEVEVARALTNASGDYTLSVSNGTWALAADDGLGLALKGATARPDYSLTVVVSDAGVTGANLSYRHADAFLKGTARDSSGGAMAGGVWVSARSSACGSDASNCYAAEALTAADGTYTLGVVGGTGYGHTLSLAPESILPGKISRGWTCEILGAGVTLTGRDVDHLDATQSVSGRVTGQDGAAIGGLGVWLEQSASCRFYQAVASTGCTGGYTLPARDGVWGVSVEPDVREGSLRRIDSVSFQRAVTLSGAGQSGADFILGPWLDGPILSEIYPQSGTLGSAVLLRGVNFSAGSSAEVYWYDDAFNFLVPTVLSYRADTGALWVMAPAVPPVGGQRYYFFVRNPELDQQSNVLCYTVTGPAPSGCTLTGTVTDGSNPVAGALVKVEDGSSELRGAGLTDGSGAYSVSLPASASNYRVTFTPPYGAAFAPNLYSGVSCSGTLNHTFSAGSRVYGTVLDAATAPIKNALVEITYAGVLLSRTLSASDGTFELRVPSNAGYVLRVVGPPGSRYVAQRQSPFNALSDTNVGTLTLSQGSLFVGHVFSAAEVGISMYVDAYRVSDSIFAGRSSTQLSNSCSGLFSIALPENTPVRLNVTSPNPVSATTSVESVSLSWDAQAQMAFPALLATGIQLGDSAPHFGRQGVFVGQVGQPVDLWGEKYAPGTLTAYFSDTNSVAQLPGLSPAVDADRGILLVQVPSGVGSGPLLLSRNYSSTDYVSPPGAFSALSGTFSPGALSVTGNVTLGGSPVSGAVVLAIWSPSSACSDISTIMGYATTSGSGSYSLLTSPGKLELYVFPPVSLGLAAAGYSQTGVNGPVVHNFALASGYTLQAVLHDGTGAAIPNARVTVEGVDSTFYDSRLAGDSGSVSIRVPAGSYQLRIVGPERSRFLMVEMPLTVSGSLNWGTMTLEEGRVFTVRTADSAGAGVSGCETWTQQAASPYAHLASGFTGYEARGSLPIRSGEAFAWGLHGATDSVADYTAPNQTLSQDTVLYPSTTLVDTGILAGTVTELGTGTPLGGLGVRIYPTGQLAQTTGSTLTCTDGTYRVKVPTGTLGIEFNGGFPSGDNTHAIEYYSEVFCASAASSVVLATGVTVTANELLNPGGSVTGSIWNASRTPLPGASVAATSVSLGSCSPMSGAVAGDATYAFLRIPTGSYQFQAASTGYTNQCWDHYNGCTLYTPVTVAQGTTTPGVLFDLGSVPAEVTPTGSLSLRVTWGTGADLGKIKVTFAKVSGAEAYNLYAWSGYNTAVAPLASYCLMVPGVTAGFVDDGILGTVTYTFPLGAEGSAKSFVASASNTVAEGTLGYARPTVERDNPPSAWRCWNSPR